jgi:hypothetical protein
MSILLNREGTYYALVVELLSRLVIADVVKTFVTLKNVNCESMIRTTDENS